MGTALSTGGSGESNPVASWWRSRYGSQLLFEIALSAALLMVYRAIRGAHRTDLAAAFSHARDVVRLEVWLGMPFEDNVQSWILNYGGVVKVLNHYYIWFHFPAAIALLLWLYLRHESRYRPFRNLMAVVTFSALVIHLLYPLAPPRLMPSGFVDTMLEYGPSIYSPDPRAGASNQIAAMPSLHFGWAMIEAMAVISVLKSRWRWIALLHPAMMMLAIIGTANHWWVDAAVAALIVVTTVGAWWVIRYWLGDRRWSWSRRRLISPPDVEAARIENLEERGVLVPESDADNRSLVG